MSKVVIVTGASQGIGREIAISMKQKGYIVIANYNKSEQSAQQLKKIYGIDIFKADVSTRTEAKKLVEYTIAKYSKIDVLINNAGISKYQLFTDITDEDWENMIQTNLYSAFVMSQEVSKNMIHNHNGCIINISSIWGLVGASMEVAYSVSKAGMNGLTKALAKELGPSNIRVNAIAPGIIDTKMNNEIDKDTLNNLKEETPLGKIGKTSDIAKGVEWLTEDEFTTGQIISINGGWIIT